MDYQCRVTLSANYQEDRVSVIKPRHEVPLFALVVPSCQVPDSGAPESIISGADSADNGCSLYPYLTVFRGSLSRDLSSIRSSNPTMDWGLPISNVSSLFTVHDLSAHTFSSIVSSLIP